MYIPKNPSENNELSSGPVSDRPRISLLNEEHWLYIRKQYSMSPRELQVAKLVCQGLNNDEIASSLKIKQGTIKTHMRNIYRRVRVKNKIEMLLKFLDNAVKAPIKPAINLSLLTNLSKKDIASIPDAS